MLENPHARYRPLPRHFADAEFADQIERRPLADLSSLAISPADTTGRASITSISAGRLELAPLASAERP